MSAQPAVRPVAVAPLPPVYRFSLPDLYDAETWLIPRILQKYPHMQAPQIRMWLKSHVDNNFSHILRTDHAVALAEVTKDFLAPRETIVEKFVLVKPTADPAISGDDHMVALYKAIIAWGQSLGAGDFMVQHHSDLKPEVFAARIGSTRQSVSKAMKLGT
jgi:hypothetical protein